MEPNTGTSQNSIQPSRPIQQPIESNPQPVKKPLPKWPLIIVGVILFATLLTGTSVLYKNLTINPKPATKITQTTNSSTSWKNLVSTADFTFSYPSNWDIKQVKNLKLDPYQNTLGRLSEPLITKYPYVAYVSIINHDSVNFALETFYNISATDKEALLKEVYANPNSKLFNYSPSSTINSFVTTESNTDNNTEGNTVFKNKLALTIINSKAYLFVLNYIQYKEEPNPEQDKEMTSTFNRIVSSFRFTDQAVQINGILTPTPTIDQLAGWRNYSDLKYNFTFKYPLDWTTQVKDYPENNQRLINIIKNSSPSVVSLSFTISNSWANTGNAQNQAKNYSVDGIPAFRLDPPQKTDYQLDRYQTNVYFENKGYIYTFACTHNWDQNYIDTCNNILASFKFTQ